MTHPEQQETPDLSQIDEAPPEPEVVDFTDVSSVMRHFTKRDIAKALVVHIKKAKRLKLQLKQLRAEVAGTSPTSLRHEHDIESMRPGAAVVYCKLCGSSYRWASPSVCVSKVLIKHRIQDLC